MSAGETCSKSAPCQLCAFKKAQSPPSPNPSPSRRGNKPRPQPMKLDPIEIVDKSDFVAIKRANNTMAARKSRQKQLNYLESLEKEGEELGAERNHWKNWAKLFEERYGYVFPTWLAGNAIPVEASPTQAIPRQAMLTQPVSTRELPWETTPTEMTIEQTRKA
jgi:hypothetical protein